jgi:hypothetical protein
MAEPSTSIAAVEKHLERIDAELQDARKTIKVVESLHENEMKRATDLCRLKDDEIEALRRQLAIYKI